MSLGLALYPVMHFHLMAAKAAAKEESLYFKVQASECVRKFTRLSGSGANGEHVKRFRLSLFPESATVSAGCSGWRMHGWQNLKADLSIHGKYSQLAENIPSCLIRNGRIITTKLLIDAKWSIFVCPGAHRCRSPPVDRTQTPPLFGSSKSCGPFQLW